MEDFETLATVVFEAAPLKAVTFVATIVLFNTTIVLLDAIAVALDATPCLLPTLPTPFPVAVAAATADEIIVDPVFPFPALLAATEFADDTVTCAVLAALEVIVLVFVARA